MKVDSDDMKCSRQAVEVIYLRLGRYLWEYFVQPKLSAKYKEYALQNDCPSVENLIAYYLDMMRQAIEGRIDYHAYRQDQIEIGSLETVTRLHARSKAFNGLPTKTFHYHFAYVSFITTMEDEAKQRGYGIEDIYAMLLLQFEQEPL